jgi:DNA-binding NarL/FixJ family response regulator
MIYALVVRRRLDPFRCGPHGPEAARVEADDRTPLPSPDLAAAQEAQIAQLEREGYSKPEIGARLFISPPTVEYHLHKVFTKLGISSRTQLDGAVSGEGSQRIQRRR